MSLGTIQEKTTVPPPLRLLLTGFKRVDHKRAKGATEYEYDARGNLVKVWQLAEGGGGPYSEAYYPVTCSNPKSCNKPLWIKDNGAIKLTISTTTHQAMWQPLPCRPMDGGYEPKRDTPMGRDMLGTKIVQVTWFVPATPIWLLLTEKSCLTGGTTAAIRAVCWLATKLSNLPLWHRQRHEGHQPLAYRCHCHRKQ